MFCPDQAAFERAFGCLGVIVLVALVLAVWKVVEFFF